MNIQDDYAKWLITFEKMMNNIIISTTSYSIVGGYFLHKKPISIHLITNR